MSIIKYGFNRQLSQLCQFLCYRAFGVNLNSSPPQISASAHTNNLLHVGYQSQIGLQLYEHYREDGFKYAEPGITPKTIAEQIEVHMKNKGNLEWIIDQFGRFIFLPTSTYLQKITANLLTKKQYQHTLLQEFPQQLTSAKQQNHYFDYHIGSQVSISQLRKIINMEYRARILEQINRHHVVRTIFIGGTKQKQLRTVEKIVNMLLFESKCKIEPVSSLLNNHRFLDKNREFQYINCDREDTVHIQKQLADHILLNNYMGNEPTHIQKLTNKQLEEKLSRTPQGLIITNFQPTLQKYKQKLTVGEIVMIYGNLLDQYQFELIDQLFLQVKAWEIGKSEQVNILEQSHRRLLAINFND